MPSGGVQENGTYSRGHVYVTVRPGATLGQIASSHDTTVASIMSLNRLHNYTIYPGERLKVPSGGYGRRAERRPAPKLAHYTVQFGDTLSVIAQKYGTSVAELKKLNRLYSNVIRQGAVLIVPEDGGGTFKTALNRGYGQNNAGGNNKKYNYYGNKNYRVAAHEALNGDNGDNCKIKKRKHYSLGKKIVNVAYRYRGVPYLWGGTNGAGMDCSGFVQRVFLKLDIKLPRTAAEQARLGKYVPKDRLEPGDLLFFRTYASYISHVGIYIGSGKFIQENSEAGKVTINSIFDGYFERTYAFAKDIK